MIRKISLGRGFGSAGWKSLAICCLALGCLALAWSSSIADAATKPGVSAYEADLPLWIEAVGSAEEARIYRGLRTTDQRERFVYEFWRVRGLDDGNGDDEGTAWEWARRMHLRFLEARARFDDLSSALDVETEAQLWDRWFPDDPADATSVDGHPTTALVVSHRRPALHRADLVVVLEDGRVADRGTRG